tara:strand:- start:2512 stop:2721 length:210 start_codon:yes stop_codon:yes gene_type:complete
MFLFREDRNGVAGFGWGFGFRFFVNNIYRINILDNNVTIFGRRRGSGGDGGGSGGKECEYRSVGRHFVR